MVTGGASGIGRATALTLAAGGQSVLVVDIDATAAADVVAEARASGNDLQATRADVSVEREVASALDLAAEKFGSIDVVIHAAGVMAGQLEDIREVDESTWDRVVDINLKGAFFVAKHVARYFVPAGSGVIILVASKAGVTVGSGSYAYGASKGGVHGLALTLDRHLGPQGIRVNDVCPGDIDTPLLRASVAEGLRHGGDPAEAERFLGHLTAPEAIAEVLSFLASPAADCVRGTIFTS